jgi:hypothetical protein
MDATAHVHHGSRRRGGGRPLVARAQHNEAMKRVAILMGGTENANYQGYVAALRQGLADVNWREDRDISRQRLLGISDAPY